MRVVWVTAWEFQCCGEPFGVGDSVTWTVDSDVDRDWLSAAIGDAADLVTDAEVHHVGVGLSELHGTVRDITAAWCHYAAFPPRTGALYPVPGSQVFEQRTRADGWEHESAERVFLGYIVEVEPVE